MAKGSKDAPTGHVEAEVYFTRDQITADLYGAIRPADQSAPAGYESKAGILVRKP